MIKQLFRFRPDNEFRTRSKERDTDTDNEAIMSIAAAIEAALNKVENERTGLKARLEDILSRAAIVGGNDSDDYLTRTEDRSIMLSNSDAEVIPYGQGGVSGGSMFHLPKGRADQTARFRSAGRARHDSRGGDRCPDRHPAGRDIRARHHRVAPE